MIVKQSKNWYTWLGKENLLLTLAKMRVCIILCMYGTQKGRVLYLLERERAGQVYSLCPHRQWLRMTQTSDTCVKRTASRLHQNRWKPPTHLYHFPTRPTSPQTPPPLRKSPHQIPTKITKHLMLWPSRPSSLATLQLIFRPKTHPVTTKTCRTHSSLPSRVKKGCHRLCVVRAGETEMVDGGTSL